MKMKPKNNNRNGDLYVLVLGERNNKPHLYTISRNPVYLRLGINVGKAHMKENYLRKINELNMRDRRPININLSESYKTIMGVSVIWTCTVVY